MNNHKSLGKIKLKAFKQLDIIGIIIKIDNTNNTKLFRFSIAKHLPPPHQLFFFSFFFSNLDHKLRHDCNKIYNDKLECFFVFIFLIF